jgi:hypothetical protein
MFESARFWCNPRTRRRAAALIGCAMKFVSGINKSIRTGKLGFASNNTTH